jgi:lipocalin
MKSTLAFLALIGSAFAQAPRTDALAKHGLEQLWLDVARHPDSYTKNCTSRTVARRREWYVRASYIKDVAHTLQVQAQAFREAELH